MFEGVYTAIVTPFTKTGAVDEAALGRLIDHQIAGKVHGIVAVGSTGESPTLSHEENLNVIELVVKRVAGRVKVIAGTGSNSTAEALDMTKQAKSLGADASLQVAPYYNKPNAEGFYRHFTAIADAVDLPMILYNIPGRTAKVVDTPTLLRLAKHPRIVGLKQSVDTLTQVIEVIAGAPKDFAVLSGDDIQTLPIMALGGHGVISVVSNVVPAAMVDLYNALKANDSAKARQIHYQLLPLFVDLFIDINPVPVKYALHLMGQIEEAYRLPLWPMNDDLKARLKATLKAQGLV